MSHVWTSQAVMAALHRLVDATDQVKLDDIVRESELERKQVSNACDKMCIRDRRKAEFGHAAGDRTGHGVT